MNRRAIFLDRDGTLIVEKHYLHKPEDVVFFASAVRSLKQAQDAGFCLIMVTNQSGVGRGYFTLCDVDKVHCFIGSELAKEGVALEKVYVAPEAPDAPSRGRKPSPRFLFDARDELGIDLAKSFMIGDKLIDLECGWNAGIHTSILVRTGYGAELEKKEPHNLQRAVIVDDLSQAVRWILEQAPVSPGRGAEK
jgi:D-glycero-D-manno-heptose 1,7-bisphosphate phosphatase